ncbi:MAG: alpha/beta hydrolase [Solirubrobacterales bacterium]
MELTERVRAWEARGGREHHRGHGVHVYRREGEGPLVLFLHGFPSSSYDWRQLLDELPGPNVLAFDFLGFGLSDKPRDHVYTLGWQADLATELVRRHADGRPVFVVAHDMGTSVTTELMARDLEGQLGFELAGVLLFNGSIVLDAATLTPSQKLLRGPLGPIAARLSSRRVFDQQFGSVFSAGHPLTPEEADDQWCLICHGGGRSMGHKLIHYLGERIEFADRWHGAIRDWRDLQLAWGLLDPVATTNVLDALRRLHPGVPVTELPDLGHYPQVEDPARMAAVVAAALAGPGIDT